jgi:hypothetical protein
MYTCSLRQDLIGGWCRFKGEDRQKAEMVCGADRTCYIPRIVLSELKQWEGDNLEEGACYHSLHRGVSGWMWKVVETFSFDELCNAVFHEALNGYSTESILKRGPARSQGGERVES